MQANLKRNSSFAKRKHHGAAMEEIVGICYSSFSRTSRLTSLHHLVLHGLNLWMSLRLMKKLKMNHLMNRRHFSFHWSGSTNHRHLLPPHRESLKRSLLTWLVQKRRHCLRSSSILTRVFSFRSASTFAGVSPRDSASVR